MELKDIQLNAFGMFESDWPIVTAGTKDHFNGCTIGWGSFGNFWSHVGKQDRPVITVMVHPDRYTNEFVKENDYFTVSFFDPAYKKALGIMGAKSGRDSDKVALAGLTPQEVDYSMTYAEANLVFVCKKVYQHEMTKEEISADIRDYYAEKPKTYTDGKGGWTPHYIYMGEVVEVIDRR